MFSHAALRLSELKGWNPLDLDAAKEVQRIGSVHTKSKSNGREPRSTSPLSATLTTQES